ncbi:lysozyme C-like [Morphnus guianensis]
MPGFYLLPWGSQYTRTSSPAGMGSPLLLLLLALLTTITKAKAFSRCEPAHVLQEEGLDGYGGYSLASCEFQSPVCPLPFLPNCCSTESTFNTAAQSIEADGGADYSIFQISSQLWCTDDRSPSDNRCRMACRDTTALLPQSQPQEWRQQPEPSFTPWPKWSHGDMRGPTWATRCLWPQEVQGDEWLGPTPLSACADCGVSSRGCASLPADLLLSNITGDIICAKRIVRNPQGMNAWEGWAMHCKGRELSEWVEGCDL